MNKKYIVSLTESERKQLKEIVAKGKAPAYTIKHAHILLKVDVDRNTLSDEMIAQTFGCHTNTVRNVRQRFVEHGLETALERNKRNKVGRGKALDGGRSTLVGIELQPTATRACDRVCAAS